MHEIIVGYDGSEEAGHALARAADVAEAFSANLVVISVTKSTDARARALALAPAGPAVVPGSGMIAVPTGGEAPVTEVEIERSPGPLELAHRLLTQAKRALADRRVEAEFVAEEGEPAERLLDVAEQRGADLIVVGCRERGLLDRLLSRHVDETLARHAHRDVLLVH